MEIEEEYCNTELCLGIGREPTSKRNSEQISSLQINFKEVDQKERKPSIKGGGGEENKPVSIRKKLRLSTEQSEFLENAYRAHATLTQDEKLELAEELNLSPRQVEVWFQNRRSRTKFKQMKMEREYLKKLCESLTEENQRLKREMLELLMLVKCWQKNTQEE
ncbi:uncharacterized protein A4U43_C03F6510 [Asparagus officinalis]|uniref:Homeobox domain-containing protein n=1 Tax=Asparagus officinalis TaxID=4686 RepID=A0A5P1FD38_ASPOF|nr:homeobox-leucine zipper protein HOX11-like [Asparagus officinalis]ONK74460.1 uncharacterized protein A4U43_C03F6510 [Asparagus officinalis]